MAGATFDVELTEADLIDLLRSHGEDFVRLTNEGPRSDSSFDRVKFISATRVRCGRIIEFLIALEEIYELELEWRTARVRRAQTPKERLARVRRAQDDEAEEDEDDEDYEDDEDDEDDEDCVH